MMETKPLPIKTIVSLKSSPEVTTSTLIIPNVTLNDHQATRSNAAKLCILLSGMLIYVCTYV